MYISQSVMLNPLCNGDKKHYISYKLLETYSTFVLAYISVSDSTGMFPGVFKPYISMYLGEFMLFVQ